MFTSQSANMVKLHELHGLHGEIEPTTAQASTSQANLPVAKPRKAPAKNLFVRKFHEISQSNCHDMEKH